MPVIVAHISRMTQSLRQKMLKTVKNKQVKVIKIATVDSLMSSFEDEGQSNIINSSFPMNFNYCKKIFPFLFISN